MKKALLCLITPLLLTGCSIGVPIDDSQPNNNDGNPDNVVPADDGGEDTTPETEVSEADILLADGTTQHLTNQQLTEDEYKTLTLSLVKPYLNFEYELNLQKYQSQDYNYDVTGRFASIYHVDYISETELNGFEYDLWTGKVEKSEYIYASDKYMDENSGIAYARNSHYARFVTYDGELETGKSEYINGLSNAGHDHEEWITYKHPNKPDTFPSNPSNYGIKTTKAQYDAMRSLVENMIHRPFLPKHSAPDVFRTIFSTENCTHSHRLTNTHFIIEETMPECRYSSNDMHRWEATYYFKLSTGQLDKVTTDFEIYNENGFVGLFSGVLTEVYKYDYTDGLKQEVHDQMNRFLAFDGVELVQKNY